MRPSLQPGRGFHLLLLLASFLSTAWSLRSAPNLAPLPDLVFEEDSGSHEVTVVLDPADVPISAFRFVATADNAQLLPPGSMSFSGAGATRTLRLVTAQDVWGEAQVTVVAAVTNQEPVIRLTNQFQLTVRPVGDPLVIEPIPNLVVTEGTPLVKVPIRISDPDQRAGMVVTAKLTGASKILPLTVQVEGTGTNWMLDLRPNPQVQEPAIGRYVVAITARAAGSEATVSFLASLVPRDFQPSDRLESIDRWPSLPGNKDPGFRWVDLGVDGYPDILGNSGQTVKNPRGGFGVVLSPQIAGWKDVVIGDVDGSGRPALFSFSREQSRLTRWFGGQYRVAPMTNALENIRLEGAVFADVDGNGSLDLVYTGIAVEDGLPRVTVALNDGTGIFTTGSHNLPGFAGPVVSADFNNDGRADLLLCSGTNQASVPPQVFLNAGEGSFVAGGTVGPAQSVTAAGVVDVDGDGVWDVWLVHTAVGGRDGLQLDVYRQSGGVFLPYYTLPSSEFARMAAPAWGDLDHDGRVDFIASYQENQPQTNYNAAAYYNDGRGGFTRGSFIFPLTDQAPYRPAFVPVLADADLDGGLDVVGMDGQGWVPFLNAHQEPNLPPNTPAELHGFLQGDQVYLLWSGAGDGNQTTPLTYNVRVGSAPGTNDLVASYSLGSGTRVISAPGNAGFINYYSFRLPRRDLGPLYWSVQAVDASYSGGLFAPEQQLAVDIPGNQPPVIEAPARIVLDEDTSVREVISVNDDRTPGRSIAVRVETSNPELLSSVFVGANNTALYLYPAYNANGRSTVRVIATDRNGASATNAVEVVVNPVNDPPSILVNGSWIQLLLRGQPAVAELQLSDPDDPVEELTLTAESSNPALLPAKNLEFRGTGFSRQVVATPLPGQTGEAAVTLTVRDAQGGSNSMTLNLIWQAQLLTPLPAQSALSDLTLAKWVDMNGDGWLDIVGVDSRGRVVVLRQTQPSEFSEVAFYDTGWVEVSLGLGDLDGDGDVDVVVTGKNTVEAEMPNRCMVLYNQGDSLSGEQPLATGFFSAFALTDLDGDGALDLIVASNGNVLDVWRHEANSAEWKWDFDDTLVTNSGGKIINILPADVNDDGRMDLTLTIRRNGADDYGLLVRQEVSGNLTVERQPWTNFGVTLGWADFDNDGHPEPLFNGTSASGGVATLIGRPIPSGGFDSVVAPLVWTAGVLGDLDGDGFVDVLGGISQFDYSGFGLASRLLATNFAAAHESFLTWSGNSLSAGDFDRDGRLDLLVPTVEPMNRTQIVINAGAPSNSPPTTPGGMTVTELGPGVVELAWSPAADVEQAGGFRYNVRVGSQPGRNDVVPAHARPDGLGLLVEAANAGWRTSLRLRGLNAGQPYYWSVQAVDAGYRRSPFAAETTFTPSGWPVISGLADLSVTNHTEPSNLTFTVSDRETPPEELTVEVRSSNPVLLPASRLTLGGAGASRTLRLEPKPDRFGNARVTLRVTDADQHAVESSFSFSLESPTGYAVEYDPSLEVSVGGNLPIALDAFDPDGDFIEYSLAVAPRHGTLSGSPPAVVYHPAQGFIGTDQFEFIASTPGSLKAHGRVTLNVVSSYELHPETRFVALGGPGQLRLVIRAPAHSQVRLEHSRDLRIWETVSEQTIPSNEALLLDPLADDGTSPRFFRTVRLE